MRILITGGSLGLGLETAKTLANQGHHIIITSRSEDRATLAISEIRAENPLAEVSSITLELADTESVDSFASRFVDQHGNWDRLVLNAGAKVLSDFKRTSNGIEYHFGVNAVSHFAITADLLAHGSNNARVVSVSSIIARIARPRLGPQGTQDSYRPGQSYAASKLSNLLFAIELDRKMNSNGLTSVAAHPGFARAEPYGSAMTTFAEKFLAQSAKRGALPIIAATSEPGLPGGSYLGPKYLELWGDVSIAKIPSFVSNEMLLENWEILSKLSGRELLP